MRIAVIADTHGRLPGEVTAAIREADEIWHLGDFCDASTLQAVRAAGPPVEAVMGNNDFGLDLPATLSLERCGKIFYLIHIPPREGAGKEFVLHGHTHVPRDEVLRGSRFLNPGAIGKANKGAAPSYAWLSIPAQGLITWEIVRF